MADGGCGLDICNMNQGCERSASNRSATRVILAEFAYKHMGNRAFSALMHQTGEIRTHLGLHGLESSFKELFAALQFAAHPDVDWQVPTSTTPTTLQVRPAPPPDAEDIADLSGEFFRSLFH